MSFMLFLIHWEAVAVYHCSFILMISICLHQLQNELSVQFDDLFKKAWDDDVMKFVEDGLSSVYINILALCTFSGLILLANALS